MKFSLEYKLAGLMHGLIASKDYDSNSAVKKTAHTMSNKKNHLSINTQDGFSI